MSGEFVDRRQLARRFSRVAASYGEVDFFAREIDRRMLERLDYVRLEPSRIVDIGCSQGRSLQALGVRYPKAELIGVDLLPQMLAAGRQPRNAWQRLLGWGQRAPWRIAGDAEKLPLPARSTALIWSNLLLHWLDDPRPALAEAHRILEVGGLLMFSTLGPDTLKEWRSVFNDGYAHTQRFIDMHDLGDMLVESGFSDPVMDMEIVTLTYDDVASLVAELRAAGSSCAMHARRHALFGRDTWRAVCAAYEGYRQGGKLPATFEVVYGHAWRAPSRVSEDGRAIIRFEKRGT